MAELADAQRLHADLDRKASVLSDREKAIVGRETAVKQREDTVATPHAHLMRLAAKLQPVN